MQETCGFKIIDVEEELNTNLSLGVSKELLAKVKNIKKNAKKQTLITRSLYNGTWLDSLQCMDGYGIYTFPDGSEYRGYCRRGHFHGFGTLHLSDPYNCTYRGIFIDGMLDVIHDMWFDDGLHVSAIVNDSSLDFSDWKYCSKKDRRFAAEQREGLPAVGPFSWLTPKRPSRQLFKNYYDVEEGIFNPNTIFLTHRPPPFPGVDFVVCKNYTEWITKHCRHGPGIKYQEDSEVSYKILRNNLKSELEIGEHVASCNYDQDKNRNRYFPKFCTVDFVKYDNYREDSSRNCFNSSSSTCSSFTNTSIDVDIHETLLLSSEYDNLKLGDDISQEASIMVTDPVVPTLK